jgi:hypothetical protein
MKRQKQSIGEMISSVAFFGAAVWLASEARKLHADGSDLKGALVFIGAFLSLSASFRFKIQRLIQRLSELSWRK